VVDLQRELWATRFLRLNVGHDSLQRFPVFAADQLTFGLNLRRQQAKRPHPRAILVLGLLGVDFQFRLTVNDSPNAGHDVVAEDEFVPRGTVVLPVR
jgi:hypothetical protein